MCRPRTGLRLQRAFDETSQAHVTWAQRLRGERSGPQRLGREGEQSAVERAFSELRAARNGRAALLNAMFRLGYATCRRIRAHRTGRVLSHRDLRCPLQRSRRFQEGRSLEEHACKSVTSAPRRDPNRRAREALGDMAESKSRVLIWSEDRRHASQIVETLERSLSLDPGQITVCTNGEEAMAILLDRGADVLLCDLGEEQRRAAAALANCKRLRPRLPIVALTADFGEVFRSKVLPLGLHYYLSRDFEENELIESVRSAIAAAPAPH